MTCQDVGLHLLDDSLPRSAAVETHLTSCLRCRDFASAHRSALSLRGLSWDVPARSPQVAVRALWKRRLAVRGALALLMVAMAGAAVVASIDEKAAAPVAATPRAPAPAQAAVPVRTVAPASGSAFEDLLREVDSYTSTEVTPHDDVLDAFGEVPHALTPSDEVFTHTAAAAWLNEDHR